MYGDRGQEMIWQLSLKPSEWAKTLVFPLEAGPGDIYLSTDPTSLPYELLDEVMYMIQAANRPVEILTFQPAALLKWMRSSTARWELVQRLTEVRWTLAIAGAYEVEELVPIAMQWPVAKRCIQSQEHLDLFRWMPHEYSTMGGTGVCEDCGVGKGESEYHRADAKPGFWRVCGWPTIEDL